MIQWFYEYLEEGTFIKIIILFSTFSVFIICLSAITVNILDWLVSIWLYSKNGWFQLNYPNFSDKVISIKYSHFVVNIDTGEIFYVTQKTLKKLKNENIVGWDYELCKYYFKNQYIFRVKELVKPKIIIWN